MQRRVPGLSSFRGAGAAHGSVLASPTAAASSAGVEEDVGVGVEDVEENAFELVSDFRAMEPNEEQQGQGQSPCVILPLLVSHTGRGRRNSSNSSVIGSDDSSVVSECSSAYEYEEEESESGGFEAEEDFEEVVEDGGNETVDDKEESDITMMGSSCEAVDDQSSEGGYGGADETEGGLGAIAVTAAAKIEPSGVVKRSMVWEEGGAEPRRETEQEMDDEVIIMM